MEIKKKLLSRQEAAKAIGVNKDTLLNWEKEGLIKPLRVGIRKDRKYRIEDLEKITNNKIKSIAKEFNRTDKQTMTLAELKNFLWHSADILRGKIDSSDYKKYIFGLLFYKRISDIWDEEYQKIVDEYHDEELAKQDYNHRFQVPKDCRWQTIADQANHIGQKLNEIFEKLTLANSPKLDKIFDDLDFANQDKFPNETLQKLISHFSKHSFGNNYINSDILGDAYEYLIEQFAATAGKKGGEFYTPREVERVIIQILKPHQKDHICDPTVGSGGFLLESYNYLKNKSGEQIAKSLYLYGQEINLDTYTIARINMFLHGLDSADIRRGDTLANPQFTNPDGSLKTYDIVVANPPYSIKAYNFEQFKLDKYGRIRGYNAPPQKNADYAFVLHMIKSLNANGRAGIVLPHGVLFRGGAEGKIRKQIIKNDLIETIIALPAKLFYGTGIPACILILNKNKPQNKKNKILIIDAEHDFQQGKKQNTLRKTDIEKIVTAHDNYQDQDKYCRIVDQKEIAENDHNLNIKRYIDSSEEEEQIDIPTVLRELKNLEKEKEEINKKVNNHLRILKY